MFRKIPWLYVESNQSNTSMYTSQPTNQIAPSQIPISPKIFIKDNPEVKSEKKKTLVLCNLVESHIRDNLSRLLYMLLNNGFKILIPKENHLGGVFLEEKYVEKHYKEGSPHLFGPDGFLHDMKFISSSKDSQELALITKTHDIPADELLFLDPCTLNALLAEAGIVKDCEEGELCLSDILNIKTKKERNRLYQQLKERSSPPIVVITPDTYPDAHDTLMEMTLLIPNLKIEMKLVPSKVTSNYRLKKDDCTGIGSYIENIIKAEFPSGDFFPAFVSALKGVHLHQLKELCINRGADSTNLKTIFSLAPSLTKLELNLDSELDIEEEWFEKNPDALKKVTHLNLKHSKLSGKQLKFFLKHLPSLKTLNLIDITIEDPLEFNPESPLLPQVKECHMTSVDPKAGQIFLTQMPALEKLSLSGNCENIFTETWCEHPQDIFKNLKCVEFKGFFQIATADVQRLLLITPALESLTFYKKLFTEEFIKDNPHIVKKFKSLPQGFHALPQEQTLEHMNLLKEVTLSTAIDKTWLANHPEALKQINHLGITRLVKQDSEVEIIQKLILSPDTLDTLSLNLRDEDLGALVFEKTFLDKSAKKLQSIKKLIVKSSSLDIATFQELLLYLPSLEELYLEEIDLEDAFTEDWLDNNPQVLRKLKTITLKLAGNAFSTSAVLNKKRPFIKILGNNQNAYTIFTHYTPLQAREIFLSSVKKNYFCDANTTPTSDPNHLDSIFFSKDGNHPHPRGYRLTTYRKLKLNKDIVPPNEAFSLNNQEKQKEIELDLRKVDFQKSQEDVARLWNNDYGAEGEVFYAKLQINLSSVPQPLPSLSVADELLCAHCSNPTLQYDITYSERDNLYYISSKETKPHTVYLDFLIKKPHEKASLETTLEALHSLPPSKKNNHLAKLVGELHEMVKSYRKFKAKDLSITSGTGQDYLNAIMEEKKGACRHRAVAFMHALKSKKAKLKANLEKEGIDEKIETLFDYRYVLNDCHAWVEVCINGEWLDCDLGGYPSNLLINNENQPDTIPPLPAESKAVLTSEGTILPIGPDGTVLPLKENPSTPCAGQEKRQDFKSFFRKKKEDRPSLNLDTYLEKIVDSKGNNILLDFATSSSIQHIIPLLSHYCASKKEPSYPVYYIDNPDEIVCKTPFFTTEKQGDRIVGQIKDGPGGPLHDFLRKDNDKPKILLVNWANFKDEDIVRFNSLIDTPEERNAHGTKILPNIKVVGLYNSHSPTAYRGTDFFERWDKTLTCPISEEQLKETSQKLPNFFSDPKEEKDAVIELYHSMEWESLLLGQWHLEGQAFTYQLGPLLQAISEGKKRIAINHGPWENPAFVRFWQKIRLDGYINVHGQRFNLPTDLEIIKTETAYTWETLAQPHRWEEHSPEALSHLDSFILNSHTLSYFLGRYEYIEKQIYFRDGWLKTYANQELSITLSRELSTHQWGRFLMEAKRYHVRLTINLPPEFPLPPGISLSAKPVAEEKSPSAEGTIFITTDRDYTVHRLNQTYPDAWVVDISECSSTEILSSLTCSWDKKEGVVFKQTLSDIWQALREKKTVILTGIFSDELVDHLASLCGSPSYAVINGEREFFPGKLILVSEQVRYFENLHYNEEYVSLEQMASCSRDALVNHDNPSFIKYYTSEQFKGLTSDPWDGLVSTSQPPSALPSTTDDSLFCDLFDEARYHQVKAIWERSPYAFLAGKTGVGKTSFVKEVLGKQYGYSVYYEEKALIPWLTSKKTGEKVLFIDEANLSTSQWSRYEGLFQNPPSLLVEGKRYYLSSEHKLLFAGNPLSYGGERHLPSLFERHGASTVFSPLPSRYITHRILKPLLENLPQTVQDKSLEVFTSLYNYILNISKDKVLITARELEMMALLVQAYWYKGISQKDMEALVYYSAYRIGCNVLSDKELESFKTYFQQTFKIEGVAPEDWEKRFPKNTRVFPLPPPNKFVLTENRVEPKQQLSDFLSVRQFKQKTGNAKGGLGGLVYEGEPGEGKSYFVIQMLEAAGFTRGVLKKLKPEAPKPEEAPKLEEDESNLYYHIPVSLSVTEKKACLLQAYKTGAVVVIDEINSSPMMERLLNALLMGDEVEGISPKPGFLLIATQNPMHRAGRKAMPQALQRRVMKSYFKEYSAKELEEIIEKRYESLSESKDLMQAIISDYMAVVQESPTNPPTPRKLFKLCEKIQQNREKYKHNILTAEKKPKKEAQSVNVNLPENSKSFVFRERLIIFSGFLVGMILGGLIGSLIISSMVGIVLGGIVGGLFIGGLFLATKQMVATKAINKNPSLLDQDFSPKDNEKQSYTRIFSKVPPQATSTEKPPVNTISTTDQIKNTSESSQTSKFDFKS